MEAVQRNEVALVGSAPPSPNGDCSSGGLPDPDLGRAGLLHGRNHGAALAASAEYFDMVERKGLRPARRMGTAAVAVWLLASCFLPDSAMSVLALLGFLGFMMVMPLRGAVRVSAMLDAAVTW